MDCVCDKSDEAVPASASGDSSFDDIMRNRQVQAPGESRKSRTMKSRLTIVVAVTLLVIGILATLVYMSMSQHQYEVEVCITFDGRQNCGTAAGVSRDDALAAATRVACATISSGVTDSIACNRTEPDRARWITD